MSTSKKQTSRHLRVHYTDAERLELGKQLAGVHQDLSQTNNDFDSVKTDFKARITGHEAKISDLSHKVSSGFRVEEVKCLWQMEVLSKHVKTLVRVDTFEVVETCDMTEVDKQVELPLTDNPIAGIDGSGVVAVKADEQ